MRFGYVLLGLVALTSIHTSSGQCSNGLAGVQDNDICCDADCGTCGGGDCGRRPGGASNCCTSRVRDSGAICSETQGAPCIIENQSMCDNGLPGVQSGDICCDASCGTCGGSGCAGRPGGSSNCCTGRVRDSGAICSETQGAPCIIENESMCDNGLPGVQSGDICCDASCGTCGGSGCAGRPGGSSNCCSSRVRDSGLMCGTTLAAPCIVNALTSACNPNPCGNGGSCTIDPAGGHTCSCTGDFGGMSCQIDTSDLATFFIEIVFIGTWTDARRAVFQSAADRWSEVITHVPCGGTIEFPAGRLLISATLEEIDGPGTVLGQASPSAVWRACNTISAEGEMSFDIEDIDGLENDGTFEGVILHEMGHVIGVGTLWGANFGECTTCRQNNDPSWMCPAAVATYADIGGSGDEIVELDGATGTSCSHLDEVIFDDELMTGFVGNTALIMSKMTAAILEDLAYIVDTSVVDAYTLPSERGASLSVEATPAVLNDTAIDVSIRVLDDDGDVFEEVDGIGIIF